MNFLFPPANSEDLSTGTYYAHLVTAEPNSTSTTAAALTISTVSNYVPIILTGLTYNTLKWTFNNFSFPTYNFTTAPIGIVICKRVGASVSSSDPIIYYGSLLNNLSQDIILTTGKYTISITFPTKGIIIFQNYYNYTSGAYSPTQTIPPGLLYLLATRNGTQTWQTLTDNSIIPLVSASLDLFNRNLDNVFIVQNKWAFSFGSRRIKVGTFAFWSRDTTPGHNWNLYGSNIYIGSGSVDIPTDWTLMGTSSTIAAGLNFITCNSTTYFKYFKLVCTSAAGVLQEIEFYDSSMYSTDEDLMSTVLESSFENDMLDASGWGHIWTPSGSPNIQNNSLYLNGSSSLSLSNSPVLNLTNRNFKLSIDFKWVSQSTTASPGIFSWTGTSLPVTCRLNPSGNYLYTLGTTSGTVTFLTLGSAGELGTPTQSNFDSFISTRTGNNLATSVVNTITTTVNSALSGTLSGASNLRLGAFGSSNITGYIRNFKVVT
jgi:hypothetical protein